MALRKKKVMVRVSSPDGTFLKFWPDVDFRGYTKSINSGVGECVIDLPYAFDYDGSELREGNDVEVILRDGDTIDGDDTGFGTRTIYRGYISLIERTLREKSESVTVHILGYGTLLSLDVLKDAANTTLYTKSDNTLSTTDPNQTADTGALARYVIERFNAENTAGRIYYEDGDIPDSTTGANYAFVQKTYREALDILMALSGSHFYWYVDETGRIKFKQYDSAATHQFVFGRHITNIRTERGIEKTRNVLLIWNGNDAYVHYEDTESVAQYGRRVERINDYGVRADTVGNISASYLDNTKDPSIKVVLTIPDNAGGTNKGYDIETINPGETCRIVGFSSTLSDIFRDNMLITEVRYTLDAVEVTVELVKSGIIDIQARQGRQISDIGNGGLGIPESYT